MEKIGSAISGLRDFSVEFVDEKLFTEFLAHLRGRERTRFQYYGWEFKFLDITGYFSEGIGEILSRYSTRKDGCKIRLISPSFNLKSQQDRNNLMALRKMQDKGIEIRVNPRMHARLFVGYYSHKPELFGNGVLLLGSFDFNREGLSGEKRNAGIIARHRDLVKSAREFFERIWIDKYETIPLDQAYPPTISRS